MTASTPRVEPQRLMARLDQMAQIGAVPGAGITRLGLTSEERKAHALFARWLEQAGMAVRTDIAGNLFGRLEGRQAGLPPILVGSHLDTVPEGGAFDGALGCVAALEVGDTIVATGLRPERPLEIVVWADEEGARFNTGFFGSRAFVGNLSEEELGIRDAAGVTLAEAMVQTGLDPTRIRAESVPLVAAYLELHIEQGPTLEALGLPVGIVSGIVGMVVLQVEVEGQAGHAGTTPMGGRADALASAADMVSAVEAEGRSFGSGAVATVGQMAVFPGAGNVIPGRCTFSIDMRAVETSVLETLQAGIRSGIEGISNRRGTRTTIYETLRVFPVAMSGHITDMLARWCTAEGLPVPRLPSGAGHDAGIIAGISHTGMLFTRCRAGISHNPAESVFPEDIVAGTQVVLDTTLELLHEPV